MAKYEYKKIDLDSYQSPEGALNAFGAEGWEVINMAERVESGMLGLSTSQWVTMKREMK